MSTMPFVLLMVVSLTAIALGVDERWFKPKRDARKQPPSRPLSYEQESRERMNRGLRPLPRPGVMFRRDHTPHPDGSPCLKRDRP